jgi:hypothetical protein
VLVEEGMVGHVAELPAAPVYVDVYVPLAGVQPLAEPPLEPLDPLDPLDVPPSEVLGEDDDEHASTPHAPNAHAKKTAPKASR